MDLMDIVAKIKEATGYLEQAMLLEESQAQANLLGRAQTCLGTACDCVENFYQPEDLPGMPTDDLNDLDGDEIYDRR